MVVEQLGYLDIDKVCLINNLNIPFNILTSAQVTMTYAAYKDMCCLRPRLRCLYEVKYAASVNDCTSILGSLWLPVVILFILVVVVLTNVSCLMLLIVDGKSVWKAKHVLTCCLILADSLMAVYLALISAINIKYNNNVSFIVLKWKGSVLCATSALIFLLSFEMSRYILLFCVESVAELSCPYACTFLEWGNCKYEQ